MRLYVFDLLARVNYISSLECDKNHSHSLDIEVNSLSVFIFKITQLVLNLKSVIAISQPKCKKCINTCTEEDVLHLTVDRDE